MFGKKAAAVILEIKTKFCRHPPAYLKAVMFLEIFIIIFYSVIFSKVLAYTVNNLTPLMRAYRQCSSKNRGTHALTRKARPY